MSIPGASPNWRRPISIPCGTLRERFNYYCEKVVKGFYKNHFLRFDRQIVGGLPATSQQWATGI
ncbi:YcjX family protein [Escherichia coli]